ncbi:hypothetical protein ACOTVQ_09660 [Aliarcobacter butzleri]|uniref:hypothetical protein n=1 Tax=Aliarcobacter TaxID=2321111 RepID=UPI0021B3998E|nr:MULTISPECIES: hypothetical protein [Aliarcobacter]MCT7501397.1 hypothetical protein [Aliarcobacter cryaerophilus]MCT7626790.1 hypothetical protein [Aliarcobacter butzleri]
MATNRKYVGKVYRSKVDMKEAVVQLSPNAFKLLNLIYYEIIKDETLADNEAMKHLGISRRPYYKAKDELKEKGYIKIIQVGSTKYKWYVGKEAISKDNLKYQNKKKKDDEKFAELVLGINKATNNQSFNYQESGVYVLEGFEQDCGNEIAI